MKFNEDRSTYIILALYVDYPVIGDTTQEAIIMKFKLQIPAKYEYKDLGEPPDMILDMEVIRTVEAGLFLSQTLYVKDVLEKSKQYLPAEGPEFWSSRMNPPMTNFRIRSQLINHFMN